MEKQHQNSILVPQDARSLSDYLGLASSVQIETFLDELSPNALAALPWLFEFWALPHQTPPHEDWRYWVLTGGRGAGKTRAGAEWVRSLIEGARPNDKGSHSRIALVADTIDQAREVMVFGESGVLACSPPDRRPKWHATRKMLEWKNGATAQIFSGSDPESLRGPQFDAAWIDEFGKWKKAEETWDMLQFGIRLGDAPKTLITTTPRNIKILKDIMADQNTVVTHAPTSANQANLASGFLEALQGRYAGSYLGRQELDGEFVEDVNGALWTYEMLSSVRGKRPDVMDRIVVAVDPPVSHHKKSDECGIVVVGATYKSEDPRNWQGYVLADLSISQARPEEWAAKAVSAYHDFGASTVIAEVNQGGAMVESMLRQIDPLVKYNSVRAKEGKAMRAEPISGLYAQNRVTHCDVFEELEAQMLLMSITGYQGSRSPDRLDALVWGLNTILVEPAANIAAPHIRTL